MTDPLDIPALLAELTPEEKASLVSGQGFWWTRAVPRLGHLVEQAIVERGRFPAQAADDADGARCFHVVLRHVVLRRCSRRHSTVSAGIAGHLD